GAVMPKAQSERENGPLFRESPGLWRAAQQANAAGCELDRYRFAEKSWLGRHRASSLLWRRPFGVLWKASRRSRAARRWGDSCCSMERPKYLAKHTVINRNNGFWCE